MSTGWDIFLVVVGVVVLLMILWKPVVLEGRVVEKNIAQKTEEDSFVTIVTPADKKIVLKFETHSVGSLIQIGGESFHDRAEELDMAIALNDLVSVESYNNDGLTRDVYKLLSVSRA
ncbi:MAG: hypothetical protein AAB897_02790 [Patescibacteria group bacterium]